jgi:hypothetical protein
LKYDREGRLQQTIKMDGLGIGNVRDMRVKGNDIFILEAAYQNFRVLRLTLDGKLIASEEIPYQFPIDAQKPKNTLEGGLTGIAIDCIERIILEVISGSKLFPLSEVQKQNDPSLITQGLLCNGKRFFVSTPGLWKDPQVTADEMIYQTKLSEGLGGLHFLDVFEDGSIYLVREDVMPINPLKVDQTVHYIDENGAIQGVARVPLSEYYYSVSRNIAVSPNGEVFALLPRPDSLDIIRLNFYKELEPLIPGAVILQITASAFSTGIFEGQPGAYFHAFEAKIENHLKPQTIIMIFLFAQCGCQPGQIPNAPTIPIAPSNTSMPRRFIYEKALSQSIGNTGNGLCEWEILGNSGNEVYVWALCKVREPVGTAGSVLR